MEMLIVMNKKHKSVIIAVIILVMLDFTTMIAMIISPNLTFRLIPLLVLIQIVGFIAIAAIYLLGNGDSVELSGKDENTSSLKDWRVWLLGWIAMLFFFRALLAIAYMAGHGWRGYQAVGPLVGIIISCYLIYLIRSINNGSRKKH